MRKDPAGEIENSFTASHLAMLSFLDKYLKDKKTAVTVPDNKELYEMRFLGK